MAAMTSSFFYDEKEGADNLLSLYIFIKILAAVWLSQRAVTHRSVKNGRHDVIKFDFIFNEKRDTGKPSLCSFS